MTDSITTEFANVLAATPDSVILRGRQYAGSEPIDCVVHISRDLFFASASAWLDGKARYYEHDNTFAGVGSIDFHDLTRRPGRVHLQTAAGLQNVLAYDASGFTVDMEHG
jgi:hypothetical protein